MNIQIGSVLVDGIYELLVKKVMGRRVYVWVSLKGRPRGRRWVVVGPYEA